MVRSWVQGIFKDEERGRKRGEERKRERGMRERLGERCVPSLSTTVTGNGVMGLGASMNELSEWRW